MEEYDDAVPQFKRKLGASARDRRAVIAGFKFCATEYRMFKRGPGKLDGFSTEYYEPKPGVGSGRHLGDDHWNELWNIAREQHGQLQRDGGDADELECDEHRGGSACGSNNRERGGDGGRCGQQWYGVHGDFGFRLRAQHHESESGLGARGDLGDYCRHELWSIARE